MSQNNPHPLLQPDAMRESVEVLLHAAQRVRSIALEGEPDQLIQQEMHPWLFGPKSMMPLLIELTMGGREITPGGYLNLMSIAHRLEPSLLVCAREELPHPSQVMDAMRAEPLPA